MSYGSAGGNKGFAIRPSDPILAQFSTGKATNFGGDGYQASHWKEQATALGIMDPAVAPQERVSISDLDLMAFDLIGWNRRSGSTAATFTPQFLSNFQTQAVQALAQRLGQTTTWVNSNPTATPASLGSDRTTDVESMIRDSQIYEWGTTGSGTTSSSGRRWMEIFNQMARAQEVYVNFSTVSKVAPDSQQTAAEVVSRPSRENRERIEGLQGEPLNQRTDEVLGLDQMSQLVGQNLSDSFAAMEAISPIPAPPISSGVFVSAQWTPAALYPSAPTSISEMPPVSGSSREPQSVKFPSGDLNTLLGVDNNLLVQTSLAGRLAGAIG
jgi:hypothetical protein